MLGLQYIKIGILKALNKNYYDKNKIFFLQIQSEIKIICNHVVLYNIPEIDYPILCTKNLFFFKLE